MVVAVVPLLCLLHCMGASGLEQGRASVYCASAVRLLSVCVGCEWVVRR